MASQLSADYLRTESLIDPVGIDHQAPHLSWIVKPTSPDLKNLSQTAYRILVATSPESLNANKADLWDTGKVNSSDTYAIAYAGKKLKSNQHAYWKVQVWDQDNNTSTWSKPAKFVIGLTEKSDWKAKWITHKAPENNTSVFQNAAWIWTTNQPAAPEEHTFTKTFNLNKPLSEATLHISADDQYRATINDQEIGSSDGRNDAWKRPRFFTITNLIKSGTNALQIKVRNNQGQGALLATLILKYKDGSTEEVATDPTWIDENQKPAISLGLHGTKPWGNITGQVGRPATMYRKDFESKTVKSATAYVTALGLVDLHLNGARVTEDLFTPGWTDYNQRLYTRAFDVTSKVKAGSNCIAAELGDGWYSGYIGWNLERDHYGTQPQFLVQLELEYADGTKSTIISDESWQAKASPTIEQDFLMGEAFDSRKLESGWNQPGHKGNDWGTATLANAPKTQLQNFPGVPVRAYETRKPISIKPSGDDKYILDFGQNLAGFARIKSSAKSGQHIKLQFVEVLNQDGSVYLANLRGARAIDQFIGNGKTETWEPRFTFHGFRYVEVSGWGSQPKPDDIQAVAISSATPEVGTFTSSDPMLNQLSSNAWWTQKMNFIDIPTDCPQRDERLGWTGDAQAYIRTAAYYSDVQTFFNKWLTTLDDAQDSAGNFPKVAPVVMAQDDGGPAWADAGVICPWAIYEFYGDKRQLAEHYPAMKKFVDFMKNRSKPSLLPPDQFHCFGDWLQINANTPNQVIYTAYFAGSTQIVAKAAAVLGHAEDAKTYSKLADEIKAAFNKEYVSADGKVRGETQCSYVLALGFDLLDESQATQAANHLVADIESRGWHLSTGFVGTRDLMHVLSKIKRNDVAFRLLHNKTFPSWGFEIENGATTIWERWDGWTPKRGFQDEGMNSFAHYAYGAVMQWVFENIGGIKPSGAGFSHITIAPQIDPNLTHATTTYNSIRGEIKTSWKIENAILKLTVTIPANSKAVVMVPTKNGESKSVEVGSGTHHYEVNW